MDTFSLNLGKQLYVFLEEVTSVKLPDDHQEFIKRLRNFEEKWEVSTVHNSIISLALGFPGEFPEVKLHWCTIL